MKTDTKEGENNMERYTPEVCEDLLKAEYNYPDIAPRSWRNQETESEKVRLFVDMDEVFYLSEKCLYTLFFVRNKLV